MGILKEEVAAAVVAAVGGRERERGTAVGAGREGTFRRCPSNTSPSSPAEE